MLGKDINIRDDLVYQRTAAGRDLLRREQERLRAVQQISYESSVEAVRASTHTEEPVKLVEQLPLLVVEHESMEVDAAATVELCLVTQCAGSRHPQQELITYLLKGQLPGTDLRAREDELRVPVVE